MRAQSRSSAHVAEVRNDASANEWRRPSHHLGSYANRRASAHPTAPSASSAASPATIATPVEMRPRPLLCVVAAAPAAVPSGLAAAPAASAVEVVGAPGVAA